MTQKVAVLGTGKIGEALLSGMIRAGWRPADLLVTARRPSAPRNSAPATASSPSPTPRPPSAPTP